MPSDIASFDVAADFHQFYLMDDDVQPPIPEAVTDQDMAARVRVAPSIAVLHTTVEGIVPVTLQVGQAKPRDDSSHWDHVVEFSVDVPSGRLVVAGCVSYLPECPRVSVPAGSLRGRASFRTSPSSEQCRISLWPGSIEATHVIKGQHAS
jgi:hypothetical protein